MARPSPSADQFDVERWLAGLRADLEPLADAERAGQMARYLRDQFPFLGLPAPLRQAAQKRGVAELTVGGDLLLDAADACWAEPPREYAYVAVDALRRHGRALGPEHLPRIRRLITTDAWWDTVDALATRVVGDLVATHRELVAEMDAWIGSDDLWLARTALLHQLHHGPDTDVGRLLGYADRRAADTDFFIRKAIGWALRQHARTDPATIRAYVADRGDRLSPLTRREALKGIRP